MNQMLDQRAKQLPSIVVPASGKKYRPCERLAFKCMSGQFPKSAWKDLSLNGKNDPACFFHQKASLSSNIADA